ncbi:g7564 [Coccomyxa elongata]
MATQVASCSWRPKQSNNCAGQPRLALPSGCRHARWTGRRAQRQTLVVAAVTTAESGAETDIWGALNDALKSPVKQAKPATPAPATKLPTSPAAPPPVQPIQSATESVSKPIEEAIRNTSTLENAPAPSGVSGPDGSVQKLGGSLLEGPGTSTASGSAAAEMGTTLSTPAPGPVQGSSLDSYFSSKADPGPGEGLSLPTDAANGLRSALGGATDAVTSAQDSASAAAKSLAEGASAQSKAALDAASAAADGFGASMSEAASTLQDAASGAASSLQEAASSALSSVNQATSGAVDSALSVYKDLAEGVGEVTSSVQDSLAASTSAAASAAEAATSSLPEPVRSALSTVGEPLGNALAQVAANPPLLAATLGAAVGVPTIAWWRGRFGGYAGLLQPSAALEVLQSEDAILVDMRSEDERVRDGVVGLPGALGKGAAVPLPYIGGDLARSVRDSNQLSYNIAAAVLSGLSQVSYRTKLLVLDGRGSRNAIQLARTLRSVGLSRAYVVEGGYRQWLAEGLPAKQGVSDYSASPADVIGERVALLADTTTSSLGKPGIVVATGAAAAVSYLALFKTLLLLRFLGVFGLLATASNRILSYNSPNDFLEDLQGISGSLTSLGRKAQKVVTAPAAAVGSLRGKLTQGSLNKPLPSSTEQMQIERTTEEQEQKQASERNVAASDSEKSVVENSA